MKIISTKDLLDLLKPEVKLNEDKTNVVPEPIQALFEKNLPEGLTMDTVNTLDTYRGRFWEAFSQAGSEVISTEAKSNADLGAMELAVDIGQHRMSVAFARPTNENPTVKDWQSSIGFGYGVSKPDAIEKKYAKAFAKMMIDDEDEE